MGRTEYYNDPNASKANTLIPASNLLVVDDSGAILLQRDHLTRGQQLGGTDPRRSAVETGPVDHPAMVVPVSTPPASSRQMRCQPGPLIVRQITLPRARHNEPGMEKSHDPLDRT